MSQRIFVWIVVAIFSCGWFIVSNIVALSSSSDTVTSQGIAAILCLGAIVLIFIEMEPGGSKERSDPVFIEACNEAELTDCERALFYPAAKKSRSWGNRKLLVMLAEEWKASELSHINQNCSK